MTDVTPDTQENQKSQGRISQPSSLWTSIRANGINLSAVAMLMAGTITLVYMVTFDDIIANQRLAKIQALTEVMPETYFDDDILENTIDMPAPTSLNQPASSIIYVAKRSGQVTGWVLSATSKQGYSGPIHILVGIDTNGHITGVRVVSHQETPGLGDKIDRKKSTWVDDFIGTNLHSSHWAVQKDGGDFDQFTGATITPRAVVTVLADTLRYYQQHKHRLLARAKAKSQAEN